MDRYKKLKSAQALVMSLDEQLYKAEQFKRLNPEIEKNLIDSYYDSIKGLLNEE